MVSDMSNSPQRCHHKCYHILYVAKNFSANKYQRQALTALIVNMRVVYDSPRKLFLVLANLPDDIFSLWLGCQAFLPG